MACILKTPTEKAKGIIVFTTQERDNIILNDKIIQEKISEMKSSWVIGLHHNWHDYHFHYNPLFDFSMAGEEDLKEADGIKFPLITMDACNFVPEYFRPSRGEKYWDILYVARAVYFKKIPEFFSCIKELYKKKKLYKVVFICSIPPYDKKEEKTVLYDVKKIYSDLFDEEEKKHFTFLALDYNYPFPIDRETLAFFYRCSKVFVHFADNERRCRVAAYAWSSGLPVVGVSCIGSLLPKKFRTKPYFYEVQNYTSFPFYITEALTDITGKSASTIQFETVRKFVNSSYTISDLSLKFEKLFSENGLLYSKENEYFEELDFRLGRHHGLGNNPNSILQSLDKFVDYLKTPKLIDMIAAKKKIDLEKYIATLTNFE